jgi:hypothetical protein
MKLTPLLLFLLLVLILVVSVIVCKNLSTSLSEGFVSYDADVAPTSSVTIDQYGSAPVIKMFDNLFFDNKNGNVIEVDSTQFLGNVDANGGYLSGNIDSSGTSISNLYVSTRDGNLHSYPASTSAANGESQISTVTSSYQQWSYNTKCQTTGKYQMFYVPWNTDTYVHIIELTYVPPYYGEYSTPTNVYTYKFSTNSSTVSAVRYINSQLPTTTPSTSATDPANNTFVNDPYYGTNQQVYQLSPTVKFDQSNANLIIRSPSLITVYGRAQNVIVESPQPLQNAGMSNTIPSVNYNAWIAYDTNGTQVIYVANGTNTLLILLQKNSNGSYDLVNTARFNGNTLDNGGATPTPSPTPVPGPPTPPGPLPDISGNAVSDYYKWYWYWNSVGGGNKYSDNYILKTQIVPPVCPKCPNCPSCAGTCTNCGGQGGSGTMVNDGKSVINNTVDVAGDVAEKTVDTAGNVIVGAEKVVGGVALGAGAAIGGAAIGASNIINNAINTTGSVANNLIDTAQAPGYGQGYGQSGTGQQPGFSTGAPPIDNYSYYGALPEKGANYMPITADFSKFGK